MKEGKFDPHRHVNYVHQVGTVISVSHIEKSGVSSHAILNLQVETEYRGRKHDPMTVPVVAWDALARLLKAAGVSKGDTLHIEGRNTFRTKNGRHFAGVTANRIGVVRTQVGAESFVEWLQEEKPYVD